jgi:Phage tail assembly chaperone proteins, E, or 41 or 14
MNVKPKKEGFVEDEPVDAKLPGPAPAEPPPAPTETWPIKVKLLYRPIRDNQGAEVRELSFREPTGGDINRYGNPVRINQDGDVVIDERKMTFIMAALTGILSPMLERMDPRDWNSCAYRLRSFFLPDPAAW